MKLSDDDRANEHAEETLKLRAELLAARRTCWRWLDRSYLAGFCLIMFLIVGWIFLAASNYQWDGYMTMSTLGLLALAIWFFRSFLTYETHADNERRIVAKLDASIKWQLDYALNG